MAPIYDALVVVMGDEDDALEELDELDELDPLTPDPLDPWPKKPPLLLLVDDEVVLEEEVVDALVAPRPGRRVATSPPSAPKATRALTTMPCFSRWTSRSASALERRGVMAGCGRLGDAATGAGYAG